MATADANRLVSLDIFVHFCFHFLMHLCSNFSSLILLHFCSNSYSRSISNALLQSRPALQVLSALFLFVPPPPRVVLAALFLRASAHTGCRARVPCAWACTYYRDIFGRDPAGCRWLIRWLRRQTIPVFSERWFLRVSQRQQFVRKTATIGVTSALSTISTPYGYFHYHFTEAYRTKDRPSLLAPILCSIDTRIILQRKKEYFHFDNTLVSKWKS